MISINLSGIQSISIPTDIQVGDEVIVVHDEKNKYQTECEPALLVKHTERAVGFIPCPSTIEKYMVAARKENDLRKYEMQRERKAITELIRSELITELFRNHITPLGKIGRLQHDEDGNVVSISIMFNIM